MEKNKIKYYAALCFDKEKKDYFAAFSEKDIKEMLGDKKDSASINSLFKYELDSLEEVTEEEAKKAPYFKEFMVDKKLCADETYFLGAVDNKPKTDSYAHKSQ